MIYALAALFFVMLPLAVGAVVVAKLDRKLRGLSLQLTSLF